MSMRYILILKRVVEESLIDFINYTTSLGVGEILLTSVDKEGTWEGYDTDLIDRSII